MCERETETETEADSRDGDIVTLMSVLFEPLKFDASSLNKDFVVVVVVVVVVDTVVVPIGDACSCACLFHFLSQLAGFLSQRVAEMKKESDVLSAHQVIYLLTRRVNPLLASGS